MQNIGDSLCFIAFALGFTLGNFFGILIEKKLALGMAVVRVITNRPAQTLIERLRRPVRRHQHRRPRIERAGANRDDGR